MIKQINGLNQIEKKHLRLPRQRTTVLPPTEFSSAAEAGADIVEFDE